MVKYIIIGFCIFSSILGNNYQIRSGVITYFGDHYLHQWQGISKDVSGKFFYDDINQSYNCSVAIPLNTFTSRNPSRDSNMLIYCKAIEFPVIEFESTKVQLTSKNIVSINGNVFFAGEKRLINTIAKLIEKKDGIITAEGEFEIHLSDFNIERPSLLFSKIKDKMKIKYSIEGEKL